MLFQGKLLWNTFEFVKGIHSHKKSKVDIKFKKFSEIKEYIAEKIWSRLFSRCSGTILSLVLVESFFKQVFFKGKMFQPKKSRETFCLGSLQL